MAMSEAKLEELAEDKVALIKEFLAMEPPKANGEAMLAKWDELYTDDIRNTIVQTVRGPSDDETNPAFPYEKLVAIVGDGGNWKWPRMWQRFDELERRGPAYRDGETLNFGQPNKNPGIVAQNILVVGCGPVGLRLAIELKLGGHKVTIIEKRREKKFEDGTLDTLGFTNRINRPHMWPFVRNDLARLNGKDLMSREACYPVFTEPETSSIGIDELQVLLIKNALFMGVEIRLGVGYVDSKYHTDPKSLKQSWDVELSYDKEAGDRWGMPEGKNIVNYDVLMGCDGPRSTVREKLGKLFGNIEKRKFMDAVGIVANVRKVPRKRLKELGFEFGQEPNDMNRTKMVFKDFFKKIQDEANADLENLIYYKASFHNYTIIVPKRKSMIDNGLPGQVYAFHAQRMKQEQKDEKEKLKNFCLNVLHAAGIPVDDQLPNGGFVDPPNDCMAFDFAECWNTPKSIAFNFAPADYDTDAHGEWMGKRLIPFVALAGDSLLEPFWPMGLGLKRGWQAIMDSAYAVDNLYNRAAFAEKLGKAPEEVLWDEHYEALQKQITDNFEYCRTLKISEELGKGEYAEKGVVMTQLGKLMKDMEKPFFEVEIDPWTRYAPLEQEMKEKINKMPRKEKDTWQHPKVKKVLAMNQFYAERAKGGGGSGGRGEIDYFPMKLISIGGKTVGRRASVQGAGGGYKPTAAGGGGGYKPTPPKPAAPSMQELAKQSEEKQKQMAAAVMGAKKPEPAASGGNAPAAKANPTANLMAGLGAPPQLKSVGGAGGGVKNAEGLTPGQQAELDHVRGMIQQLETSLAGFRKAEQDILAAAGK